MLISSCYINGISAVTAAGSDEDMENIDLQRGRSYRKSCLSLHYTWIDVILMLIFHGFNHDIATIIKLFVLVLMNIDSLVLF